MNNNELIFSIVLLVGILIFLKMIASMVTESIKRYHEGKQHWGRNPNGVPPMFQKMSDKAMAERDAVIDSLQERIEVLEKIVTDQYKDTRTRKLSDEIDKL